ncbi:reverse transcriptase-like protein, partial [Candidatus Kaiserbacteria bacterium]|nr:reverse transcriptase-like protein [Candidatus Kaiserbacteria bacterium]
MRSITIFTDGGARGNPGPAGSGAVIYDGKKKVAEISKFLGIQTNNFAEYEALLLALQKTKELFGSPVPHPV